jgi:predicted CXXCH cytochrome family protein
MMVREANLIGSYAPATIDLSLPDYLAKTRPNLWPANQESHDLTVDAYKSLLKEVKYSDAREHAVTLGISCEACHLGAKEHAQGKLKKPKFFPYSPEFAIRADKGSHDMGRTHDNLNYACSRCHNGSRQLYAAGMSTWNSTEYTDATRGACYSQLTCVKCHDPHQATGQAWTKTSLQDDAICLSCHKQLEPAEKRMAHTHHSLDNEGSRCMNCHMPRINEGLQEVVRTHTIFSPTNRAMIESNQMNACNQCHVDKPIDWTVAHLKDWYKTSYSDAEIAKNYPDRKAPAAINWLKGKSENVRLVAADTLARANAKWALPDLIDALDDQFMLNRQFTRIGLERMLGLKLSDFKYEFFLTAEERKEPIKKMKEALLPPDVKAAAK